MNLEVGMLLFPRLTQLDLTGPLEVLHRVPGARVSLFSKSLDPVPTSSGMSIVPTAALGNGVRLDALVVPGGHGTVDLLDDGEVLDWLVTQAATARYVTSVCTGALVLGAAGLLEGYAATTHWAYLDVLPLFGARATGGRVVIDRNRITAGGVTSGIDFGLRLAAEIAGEHVARAIQLGLEYDPEPPWPGGHPDHAPAALVDLVRTRLEPSVAAHRAKARIRRGATVSTAPAPK